MKDEPVDIHRITVASPCTVSWKAMKGDDQVRHCGECKMNVFNLSALSLEEVAALVKKAEGRMCVRFYRRADGTLLTDDCPVGLRAVRRKMRLLVGTLAASLAAAVAGVGLASPADAVRALRRSPLARFALVERVLDWVDPRPPVFMGMVRF